MEQNKIFVPNNAEKSLKTTSFMPFLQINLQKIKIILNCLIHREMAKKISTFFIPITLFIQKENL